MSAEEFVDAVTNEQLRSRRCFKDAMTAKVGDALETKRKEVARTFVRTTYQK